MLKTIKVLLVTAIVVLVFYGVHIILNNYQEMVGGQTSGMVKFSSVASSTAKTIATTTGGTIVVPANPNRIYARFMNNGSASIYLNLGGTTTVATTNGIRLDALGVYEINQNNLYTGQVTAITSSTTAQGTLILIEK